MSGRGLEPPPGELPELPTTPIGGERLWRIHRGDRDPLAPSGGNRGRFSLRERGVLYSGTTQLAAFVEVFGRLAVVDQAEIGKYRLSELQPVDLQVVDLTSRSVLGRAGITAEIHSTTNYGLTQAWAEAIASAGSDGIKYRARLDPSSRLTSVVLFATDGKVQAQVVDSVPVPRELTDAAEREFELHVLPRRLRRR